jgi:hypothetical protein
VRHGPALVCRVAPSTAFGFGKGQAVQQDPLAFLPGGSSSNRYSPVVTSLSSPPVWTCLALGVRVRFIPFAEPWRNPVIEHFNDVFDKGFFRIETFQDLAHLKRRACDFERFHNSHHRYSALNGVTPDEFEKRPGFEARLLAWRRARDLAASPRLDRVRQAHPIQPRVEDPRIQDLDATGVRASLRDCVLHVRTQRLVVECAGHPWRAEPPFSLKR